jgi:hypothetical protein
MLDARRIRERRIKVIVKGPGAVAARVSNTRFFLEREREAQRADETELFFFFR